MIPSYMQEIGRKLLTNKMQILFISIHANSLPETTTDKKKQSIKGAEVYVMGAQNTNRALEVAKRENSVILP